MDTFVIECSGCWSRFPARYVTEVDGKAYCRQCWRKIVRLVADTKREPRGNGMIDVEPVVRPDRQRERNRHKPDVMDARIPERRNGSVAGTGE